MEHPGRPVLNLSRTEHRFPILAPQYISRHTSHPDRTLSRYGSSCDFRDRSPLCETDRRTAPHNSGAGRSVLSKATSLPRQFRPRDRLALDQRGTYRDDERPRVSWRELAAGTATFAEVYDRGGAVRPLGLHRDLRGNVTRRHSTWRPEADVPLVRIAPRGPLAPQRVADGLGAHCHAPIARMSSAPT